MKRHWFFILVSLADHERHGLDIMRDVLELTSGDLKLWPATLYGSLEELRERGLIEELSAAGEHPEGESERKRFYRITDAGRRSLEAETRRLAAVVNVASLRLGEAR